ncbi:hypothetical protein [Streptomyces nodosus]|uniref:hypothetical protein n=1 Tax=Streptomyces nodosus TaxID=40318 RepID=UPI0037F4AB1A
MSRAASCKGLSAVPATSPGDSSGLWGTVDHPIRAFLADQAAHLAVAPAALYAFWQLTGLLGLVGGFLGNAGARIAWLLFGIGSLAMIWSASPAGGRAAATGLAALMWALASIFALRGLTLRPIVHNHPPQYQFSPALHLHAAIPAPTRAGDDFDDEPDTVLDNAGNTSTYDHLSAAPVHVTSNDVLSADGFTATPNPVNTWHGARTIKVGFRPHGDQGGVTSAVVDTNSVNGCRQTSTAATTAADGTVSVDYDVPRQVFTCHITGLIITDNAGNVALYGSEFGAPETGLTITSAPDTVLPEIDQAMLSPTTIPATEHSTDIRLAVNVSGTTAGVTGYDVYLIDSSGQLIPTVSGGAPLTFSGPLTISFPLPFNVAPGTYTIALRLSDQAYKSSSFGFPNGTPMSGGPVTLTVT